jgi:aminoglycoside phosphotransferase (APT) family kinase protein
MLGEHVWYLVSTAVNVGEPLFELLWAKVFLYRALRDAKGVFFFDLRGLMFKGALLAFYIKPADGVELPDIMQWMMNFVHDERSS